MDAGTSDNQSLDYIGILEGTDKTSLANDYLGNYERVLGNLRNTPFQLLEVGVSEGASLRTWEKYLPLATIIGVDNNERCRAFAGGRVQVEIGSQADPTFLTDLASRYQPAVIIDDGSHQSAHVFVTFEHLFPALQPGGIYIIEDLYLHHGVSASQYHAQGGITPAAYIAELAQRVAAQYVEPSYPETDRQHILTIDRIEFIPRAIIIHKRDKNNMEKRLDYLFEAAKQADQYQTWFHLSWVLMNHDDFARAEIAAQRALNLAPHSPASWPRLADAQARQGKLAEAIMTLQEGIKIDPNNASLVSTLRGLEARFAAR